MSLPGPKGYAFNQTRCAYLAKRLRVAETHWSRLRGLMMADAAAFPEGQGLWITPSHGVHTFAMRFPIDVIYLDRDLKPWRVAAVRRQATSVLELPGNTLSSTGTAVGDKIEIVLNGAVEEL